MSDCVFCKIVSGEIPSPRVYEDDKVIAINDLSPIAPVHVLIIPKKHTENIVTAPTELVAHVKKILPEVTKKLGIAEKGFRLIVNTGAEGGQTVPHLHFHILGGKELGWPKL
ncbi:histidine triad nucleotide-binding protein [Acidaminococcus sp.]|jgi:histidine triad (HIT) family protein|uniref:Histidine triad nucleotide-binding protein n=1 Tax=Acidaminococcus intestini TaxID=187327 RepID=A0A943EJI4_9FIRM|nr:histidine triad nucleotide-binding protein [Acidaminococcus sp.]MBS5519119.1 histidine triad nucleotide-binding protein [Acidaminococcus intestini]MDY2738452.1 histidine triad nucleotide-binding protein [Acidaminococcus sp.]